MCDSVIDYFADLHIHVGRSSDGHPVKIAASPSSTLRAILDVSMIQKGLDMIGIVALAYTPAKPHRMKA